MIDMLSIDYQIKEYYPKDLDLLKTDWNTLENGHDMTYFQSFDWYHSINDNLPNVGEVVFFLVLRENSPVLIAPLWILRNRYNFINHPGCYFWGREGYSDYLNFVYKELSKDCLSNLMRYVKSNYKIKECFFEFLKEDSMTMKNLIDNYSINDITHFNYPVLILPESKDEYMKLLSKHIRQNLRTANNRAKKDGIGFSHIIVEGEATRQYINDCIQIRESRLPYKQIRERNNWSLKTKVHMALVNWLKLRFNYTNVIKSDKNGKLLLVFHNDEIASFFFYGYERNTKRVIIMTAGTNSRYARYSPGFYYLYQQILEWIEVGDVREIDFTRGGESYKYDLGCTDKKVCNIRISI